METVPPQSDQVASPEITLAPETPTPKKIGKFRASLAIVKASFALLLKDKEVLWFPVFSVIASFLAFVILGAIYFFAVLGGQCKALEQGSQAGGSGIGYVFLFLIYFVSYFIVVFFQTGIVAIVYGRMSGQDLSFGDGLKVAFAHTKKIALWSALSATVGVILRAIAERSELLGRIVVGFLGATWSIVTFFIVPVLILDNLSVGESLKESGSTVKKMWGESLIVNVGAGFVFFLLALLGVVVFVTSLFIGNSGIALAVGVLLVLYFILLAIVSSTLDVIFRVMLYQYAKNGMVPEGVSPQVLQAVFVTKK